MKFWGKLKQEDRILKDAIVTGDGFKAALASFCNEFDLSKPVLLEKHLNEINSFNRTVFYPDDFIESVAFDSFEIEKIVTKKKL
jgi:hypothetical protein